MIVLDTTVVNVALAAIGDDLDAGIGGLQWVVDGYVVLIGGGAVLVTAGLTLRFVQ